MVVRGAARHTGDRERGVEGRGTKEMICNERWCWETRELKRRFGSYNSLLGQDRKTPSSNKRKKIDSIKESEYF